MNGMRSILLLAHDNEEFAALAAVLFPLEILCLRDNCGSTEVSSKLSVAWGIVVSSMARTVPYTRDKFKEADACAYQYASEVLSEDKRFWRADTISCREAERQSTLLDTTVSESLPTQR